MSYTFAGFVPRHRCSVPCMDQNTTELSQLGWYQTIDPDNTLQTECEFYDYLGDTASGSECEADMFNTSSVTTCSSHVFDRSVFQETLVTKFDLVCSDSWKKGFIGGLSI